MIIQELTNVHPCLEPAPVGLNPECDQEKLRQVVFRALSGLPLADIQINYSDLHSTIDSDICWLAGPLGLLILLIFFLIINKKFNSLQSLETIKSNLELSEKTGTSHSISIREFVEKILKGIFGD